MVNAGPPPARRRPATSAPAEPTDSDSLDALLEQIPRGPGGHVPDSIDQVSRAGAVGWSAEQRAANGLAVDPDALWFLPADLERASDDEIADLVRRVPRR